MALINTTIPNWLKPIVYSSEGNMCTSKMILRTPSAQWWDMLSEEGKTQWKELVRSIGKDPEDYLNHMRSMLPQNPRGK